MPSTSYRDDNIRRALETHFRISGRPTIRSDGSVDVVGDVETMERDLLKIPVKFGTVTGDFNASFTLITSLINSPRRVGGFCSFYYTNITSLEGAPEYVGGNFIVSACRKLDSLTGAPKKIGGFFGCDHNNHKPYYMALLDLTNSDFSRILLVDKILSGICNKYSGTGARGVLPFASELIAAGFEFNARF